MNWLKFISVGLFVMKAFKASVKYNGVITVEDILFIGTEAAKKAGFPVEDIKWEVTMEKEG